MEKSIDLFIVPHSITFILFNENAKRKYRNVLFFMRVHFPILINLVSGAPTAAWVGGDVGGVLLLRCIDNIEQLI